MRAVVEEPPAPAVRAGALAGVLYGLLEKDPGRRWNVETARAVLRDLMVGPLASNAPAHVTDPYAVVRPTPYQPPVTPPPSNQIGGRAMMAPGETVSSALRRMQQPQGPQPAQPPRTDPGAPPLDQTNPAMAQAFTSPGHPFGADWTQAAPPVPAAKPSLGARAQQALDAAKRVPRWAQIAVAAGTALVLFLIVGAVAGLFDGSGADPTAGGKGNPSAGANGPLIEVQEFHDSRGITVNVPKSWTKQPANGGYTDFFDPDDKGRKVRVNVESGSSPRKFLEVAENNLKTRTSTCSPPYTRVNLTDVTLDNKAGAQLEYTCGSGAQQRHALWAATIINGKSYEFFLTVPASRFDESRIIYEEMVRSFKVSPAN
jgi:hypothetical protein